ncbi:MAG: hypothetical protein M1837_003192 [Sclerophora amabilis]|nr:MAG: hypothetical protein M1837_003192 [Sclerophora amabilis]
MLSSLLRPKKGRRRADRSPFSSPFSARESSPLVARRNRAEAPRRPARQYEHSDSTDESLGEGLDDEEDVEEDEDEDEEEDEDDELSPLLPLFSAAHLDSLPVYNLAHTIRLLIVPRCETTLAWDQLRSPQVSQFLVKPIQQQIRTSHFSRATIYALMANCLQFIKESQSNPANSGVSKTRALFYADPRVQIDALSYDFYPLQGLTPPGTGSTTPGPNWDASNKAKSLMRAARISTLEISIQAQAKRFLAHPVVVQHLEAIWAGSIVFHSAADGLHRKTDKITPNQTRGYATVENGRPVLQASPSKLQPAKQRQHQHALSIPVRRSVTLYDPRDASLFKLSRLRVPRYRQVLSTCSLAVLLCLFVVVLVERSLDITSLEIIFWLWSAGFMLDELVGFNEQGFGLYIMSVWNSFDLGILLILIVYYAMRLYGILMSGAGKNHVKNMAYDVLAANAVLLFPRLFSVLDHYRYFSQLLIAFRMMAMDLVAVFVLIVISCSGFFVAFTLSFGKDDYDAKGVAYSLFQMLMGFTPAAWNTWDDYNPLGKIILTLFLFICHFLIVTILITVLTNSFMAIVANANEEHQFLFAVNTISMVKSDALFSYVAPTNVIAWLIAPLRYFLSFRRFVKLNRTVIKVTHFPVLFTIFAYERIILRAALLDPSDLIDNAADPHKRQMAFNGGNGKVNFFSPHSRRRHGSVANLQRDRALDEVFKRVPKDGASETTNNNKRGQKASNAVDHWMQGMGPDGRASPPMEQDRSIVDRLETRRSSMRRPQVFRRRADSGKGKLRASSQSVASDPEDFHSSGLHPAYRPHAGGREVSMMSMNSIVEQTDADGDDELLTNDEDENENITLDRGTTNENEADDEESFFKTPTKASFNPQIVGSFPSSIHRARFQLPTARQKAEATSTPPRDANSRHHSRKVSSSTMIFNPPQGNMESSSSSAPMMSGPSRAPKDSGTHTPKSAGGRKSPRRPNLPQPSRPRPIMPTRTQFQSAPNLAGMAGLYPSTNPRGGQRLRHRASSLALDLTSDIGIGDQLIGAVPSSFATQMAMATAAAAHARTGGRGAGPGDIGNLGRNAADDSRMMSRLVLARMKTLEEGFHEVLKEVKEMRNQDGGGALEDRKGKKSVVSSTAAAAAAASRKKKSLLPSTKQVHSEEEQYEQRENGNDGVERGNSI